MKPLIEQQKYTKLILTTLLMVIGIQVTSLADITPVSDRTPQVRDAIVAAVPGVNNASDVTEAHLASITELNLRYTSISALKVGDFSGLTALTNLNLYDNDLTSLPEDVFDGLTALIRLELSTNDLTSLPSGIFDELTALTALGLSGNDLTSLPSGIFDELIALTTLNLNSNDLSSLPSGIFDELIALTTLNLNSNDLSSLPSGIFDENTALTYIALYNNDLSSLPSGIFDVNTALTTLYLERNDLTSLPSGVFDNLTTLTRLTLHSNQISDVSELEDLTSLTTLYLSGNPISDYGPLRNLKTTIEAAGSSISIDIDIDNNPPVFSDGDSTTRSIAENTASGQNIGDAVAATDADTDDTLTYSLGGTDASSFSIVSTSGQLQTSAALDYETKSSYTVTVDVSDGNDGLDRITVTINVTDVENAAPSVETPPIIPENTALLTNFPNPFNPETWIPYQLSKSADVTLTIYNMRGVVVRELKLGHKPADVYTSRSRAIHWDGRNSIGEKVATGVYFYTLKAGDWTATRKMLIWK